MFEWLTSPETLASLSLVVIAFFFQCSPCCGDPCNIFSDDFATDNLATDWDDRSGTWTVSGGELHVQDADALIVATTEVPAGADGVYCHCTISLPSSTDTGRVVIAYDDDDNYWFAELQPGGGIADGSLILYERSGGTNTSRGSTAVSSFNPNEPMELQLCYADGEFRASAQEAHIDYTATVTIEGTKCGVGTGAGTGTRDFDDFLIADHQTDDPECYRCKAGCGCVGILCGCVDAPIEATVTLGGFSNGSCASCANLNATFIVSGEWTSAFTSCISPTHATGVCGKFLTVTKIDFDTARVRLITTGPIWEGPLTADCLTVVDESIPFDSETDGIGCIHDGTTAAIITLA